MKAQLLLSAAMLALSAEVVEAADVIRNEPVLKVYRPAVEPSAAQVTGVRLVLRGRVAVMDGRTLWYPQYALSVQLADIDACELPQWALDPKWEDRERVKAPLPVPCGPFAKAWLKRTVGDKSVTCNVVSYSVDGTAIARCTTGARDLALEMLRVGWARVASPYPVNGPYAAYQRYAMAARYGMWATYVLDMNEWRRKAVDKTLERRPIADFNLLAERENEISPPFADARKRPLRTDR
ncbi:thermonuclease family protein [Mesorhizobium sp. M2E.F.Ca.ET.219.01.1.1]|uniref:thermonuclease family protein n=1 Tax=Mesorhizobium sp. M2E.F.Ca.ET.219.01.1.1 TaxID=2500530 RepID=UPI000FDA51F4|nr:thermonuclease family protein [Mesorhizobium sp. M2E.F.Ca.ET.219.01.1.1]TGQ04472.1 thermonuclease family protein [Mesorhizobium sp. M2E.F.Ca.ET.219.01.1.1]